MVHEPIGKKPNREQKIDIYFNFIGQFELAYSSKEIAELKKQADKVEAEKKARQKMRNQEHQARAKAKRYAENNGHKFPERICEYCGKPFHPNGSQQRYCTKDCTYSAQQETIKQKRFVEKGTHTFTQKECQICGKKFWPSNGREVLCSEKCKVENRRRKQLEYYYKKQEKENVQWNDSSQTKEQVSITNSLGTTTSHSSMSRNAHPSEDTESCDIAI